MNAQDVNETGCVQSPLDESACSAKALIAEMVEYLLPCNPQAPELQEYDECPEDHEYCCGRCELLHRARKFLK
jgi:hypothetical protein